MVRVCVVVLALVLSVTAAAAQSCRDWVGKTYRNYVVVGQTLTGVAGYLAHPGEEISMVQPGVWFPPNTYFRVYPGIQIEDLWSGERHVMVMSDKGIFAHVRPDALNCWRRGDKPGAPRLSLFPQVLVGRPDQSSARSFAVMRCGLKASAQLTQTFNVSFGAGNLLTLGGGRSGVMSVSHDGTTNKTIYVFERQKIFDPKNISYQRMRLEVVQKCVEGQPLNKRSWTIEIDDGQPFTVKREDLERVGLTRFSSQTEQPFIRCKDHYDRVIRYIQDEFGPIAPEFEPIIVGMIGRWKDFAQFSQC